MCGIVGAVSTRDVTPILIEGLKRLEYRGYDSAGVAILSDEHSIGRIRTPGKIKQLEEKVVASKVEGLVGVGHTRWATHGKPTVENAHPHVCRNSVAVVHNGIIENHTVLRKIQEGGGYKFTSETDTEVIVHQVFDHLEKGLPLFSAVARTVKDLKGAFALGVVSSSESGRLVVARQGSPLVVGVGVGEYFIASDVAALLPVTQQFIFLEDGDVAELTTNTLKVVDSKGAEVSRKIRVSELRADSVQRGEYRHYMLKEIYEQPAAISETIESRISQQKVLEGAFGVGAANIFDQVKEVKIIACGTSYHAGMVARYWFERFAGIPCDVEVASEFRYRKPVVKEQCLVVTISQSGETADTLAALQEARRIGFFSSLAICNVAESSLIRLSDLQFMTRAGPEIGVASTKAFTTQLVSLIMLVIVLGRRHSLSEETEAMLVGQMLELPRMIDRVLEKSDDIKKIAERFADKQHALFLGRGAQSAVAMEGALKLKEISYIHAEAYPAGELKHGPLALVDADMPVVVVAPNNELLEKLQSNLQEVQARGGELIVFADEEVIAETTSEGGVVIGISSVTDALAPILYTIPLQLLAYHVAVLKGTDIDQPRNLAKSVTVE